MKVYAADLGCTSASNTQDRVLPKRLTITAFDPDAGTIEIALDTPIVEDFVSVLGACALEGDWTRIHPVQSSTESTIHLAPETVNRYNFFKVTYGTSTDNSDDR